MGDLSGIQPYLFDVAESGGGQAQRFRARSFFLQILPEAAALRVLQAMPRPPRLNRPTRRFVLIDRRPPAEQDTDQFVPNEFRWLEAASNGFDERFV